MSAKICLSLIAFASCLMAWEIQPNTLHVNDIVLLLQDIENRTECTWVMGSISMDDESGLCNYDINFGEMRTPDSFHLGIDPMNMSSYYRNFFNTIFQTILATAEISSCTDWSSKYLNIYCLDHTYRISTDNARTLLENRTLWNDGECREFLRYTLADYHFGCL